uniref:M48 family metalloprotease n=1 Tax=Halorhabdus salina TaxID=2750670 RepID=UPI0015EEA5C0
WYYLVLASIVGTAISFFLLALADMAIPEDDFLYAISGPGSFTSMIGTAALMISMMLAMFSILGKPISQELIPKMKGISGSHTDNSQHFIPRFIHFISVILGFFGYLLRSLFLLLLGALLSSFVAYWLVSDEVTYDMSLNRFREIAGLGFGKLLRIAGVQQDDRKPDFIIPAVAGEYVIASIIPLLVPLFVIGITIHFGVLAVLMVGVALALTASLSFQLLSDLVSGDAALDAFNNVKENHRIETSKRLRVFWSILVIGISYLLLGSLLFVLYFYRHAFFNLTEGFYLALVAVIAVSPISYFIVGLLYQTVHWLKEKFELIQYSKPLERDLDTSAHVYEIEDVKDSPASLSTGLNDYIFIPSEFLDGQIFDKEELKAIVAHEEKHLRSREALLFFYIPLISILLFTGQNVIYSLLNFREREFQADQYAKNKVGRGPIISALQTTNHIDTVKNAEDSKATEWQENFGIFYGTYTHSEAHPDPEERVNRLKSEN